MTLEMYSEIRQYYINDISLNKSYWFFTEFGQ